jgi:hypothetical protein
MPARYKFLTTAQKDIQTQGFAAEDTKAAEEVTHDEPNK